MFEVIIAGALNFKMAASGLVSVTEEVINTIKKIKFQIAQMMPVSLMYLFSKERHEVSAD